jgi:hypothetical protein
MGREASWVVAVLLAGESAAAFAAGSMFEAVVMIIRG